MDSDAVPNLGLQAFPHVTVAPNARLGYQFLMTCGGLGGLDVNTVVIPLLRGLSRSASGSSINDLFAASNISAAALSTDDQRALGVRYGLIIGACSLFVGHPLPLGGMRWLPNIEDGNDR